MKVSYRPGRRNIGPREVRRRLWLGIIGTGAGLVLLAWLYRAGAPPLARLLVGLPLLLAVLGFVQAKAKT